MSARGPPLDELQHHRPDIIEWWVKQWGGQPMDENMIHRYLSESPFFDYTTKNGLIFSQATTIPIEDELTRNRRALEERLSKQNGTEYMIVGEPQQALGGPNGTKTGMYLLRKQDRSKARPSEGRYEDKLTTLGTYYVAGECMYQAPSVGDVVGNRLLMASACLSKFLDEASSLPTFSPTSGYSYQTQKQTKQGNATSNTVSPARSREGSTVPGVESPPLRSSSAMPETQANAAQGLSNPREARLLEQSMKLFESFSEEFVDENPILGEPGQFTFTSSTGAVKKRKADEEASAAEKLKNQQATPTKLVIPKPEKSPSPPPVMTEAKALKDREKDRRGSKSGDKSKRKKSRATNAQSPTTPGSTTSTQPPNSAL